MARPKPVILSFALTRAAEPPVERLLLAVPEADWGWEVPSPDAKVAVLIDRLGHGRVWSLASREARLTSAFRTDPLPGDLAVSPNGFFVLPDRRGERVAFMAQNSERLGVAQICPFRPLWSRAVKAAYGLPFDWSPDGGTLCVAVEGGTRLLSADGRERGTLPIHRPLAFHGGVVYGLAKGGVAGYDLATRRPVRRVAGPGATEPLGVSPDGRWLIAGSHRADKYLYRVWRLSDGRAVGECPGASQNLNDGFDPEFLPGDRFRLNGLKEVHALPSGRLVARLPGWAPVGFSESGSVTTRLPHVPFPPATVASVHAWPQAGGRLIVGGSRGALVLDPVAARARTLAMPRIGGIKEATARDDGTVVLNGNLGVEILPPSLDAARFVAAPRGKGGPDDYLDSRLEPGGREAVGRTFEGDGVRWRVDDGRVLGAYLGGEPFGEFRGPGGTLYRQFPPVPNGLLERVGVWKVNAVGRFTSRAVPSPDGRTVVVAEDLAGYEGPADPWLRVLDAATGQELRRFRVPEVRGLALSPDGSVAALRESDGIELRPLDGSPGRKVPDSATQSSEVVWWGRDRVVTLGNFPQSIDARTARVAARWASWPDGAWVAWTPEGTADGTPSGLARLYRPAGVDGGVAPIAVPTRPTELWRALRPSTG